MGQPRRVNLWGYQEGSGEMEESSSGNMREFRLWPIAGPGVSTMSQAAASWSGEPTSLTLIGDSLIPRPSLKWERVW